MDDELLGLALVVVLAVGAQLLAARLVIPAIVPLLALGVLAGDATGLIDPAQLLGPSLDDAIAIAVGVILFQGALGLRREDLRDSVRPAVLRLLTVGVAITWAGAGLAIWLLLDVPASIAILVGAILIVSGPTVVLPMLEFIRPLPRVRAVLTWEGILVDPVGAILAVLAFNTLDFGGEALSLRLGDFTFTLLAGLACGAAGALVLMPLLRAGWLAERQKVAATLMAVVAAFAAADLLREDAGLVAAIAMGLVLANQRRVDIAQIVEFKETLGAILLGILFVLLAAEVDVAEIVDLGWPGLAVVAALVLLVRPLAVLASTVGGGLSWRERAFVAGMAPRGIVAASTAAVFGAELAADGVADADRIVPIVFLVIAGTVIVYAGLAPLLANVLALRHAEPAGVLLIGAAPWARDLARALADAGAEVRVWSPRAEEARAARAEGLDVCEDPLIDADAAGGALSQAIGTVLVLTDDDALNDLLVARLAQELGTARVLALPRRPGRPAALARDRELEPPLFAADATAEALAHRHAAGERIAPARTPGAPDGLALVLVREGARGACSVHPFTVASAPSARPGDLVLTLAAGA
jgi:NhaP-type Na+/H+ or K+/H+ antiporter